MDAPSKSRAATHLFGAIAGDGRDFEQADSGVAAELAQPRLSVAAVLLRSARWRSKSGHLTPADRHRPTSQQSRRCRWLGALAPWLYGSLFGLEFIRCGATDVECNKGFTDIDSASLLSTVSGSAPW